MPAKNFDLIVIGSGEAGGTVASKCRSAQWNVAVIDSQPFGGTCPLRGCDPKKVLVGAAQVIDWNRRMKGRGVSGDAVIEWPSLMRFKRTFTDPVSKAHEEQYAREGIVAFHSRVRFVDQSSLAAGGDVLKAKYFVIAAGAKPRALNISGEEFLTTSTQFLELDQLPKRIVFVGGGYIAFEFAHVAIRAGAHVRIINRGRPLKGFDSDLVDELLKATRDVDIDVQDGAVVQAIEKGSSGLKIRASTDEGEQTFDADMVVHAAGRVPDIDDLGLDAANVQRVGGGVVVNDYLQSVSNPTVYAAGDAAASGLPLTPSAILEADVVSRNMLQGNKYKPDYRGIATVVYTEPPLSSVGLSVKAASEQGLEFDVKQGNTANWYNSRRVGATHGGFKVLIERGSNRVLGAHLLGPHADETINLFSMAIRFGLKASEIKDIPFAYPTHSYDIGYML